jgi:hypothetical protein
VPTFVVGFRPGGRNWRRFLPTVRSISVGGRRPPQTTTAPPSTTSSVPVT